MSKLNKRELEKIYVEEISPYKKTNEQRKAELISEAKGKDFDFSMIDKLDITSAVPNFTKAFRKLIKPIEGKVTSDDLRSLVLFLLFGD